MFEGTDVWIIPGPNLQLSEQMATYSSFGLNIHIISEIFVHVDWG